MAWTTKNGLDATRTVHQKRYAGEAEREMVSPPAFPKAEAPGNCLFGWFILYFFNSPSLYHVLPEIDRPYARSKVQAGDLLLSIVGYVGQVAQVPAELTGANITQTTARVSVDPAKADSKFLLHYLSSPYFRSEITRYEKGSAQPGLNLSDVARLRVKRPSLPQQRRIAEVLSTVDEAIEQTEGLIAKYQQIKAGLMHDLFTRGVTPDGRLRPTRTQAPHIYDEFQFGWIPKEWEVRPFRTVLVGSLQNGYFKKPELVGSGYKLVNVSELYQPFGIDTDHPTVERVGATSAEVHKYNVDEGDLFFTRSSLVLSGIAQCNTVLNLKEPTLFECHVIRGRPDKNIVDPSFLGLYFQTSWARRELMSRAKQTTMTTISQPDIFSVPVVRPPLNEQTMIVQRITANMVVLQSEEGYLAKLRQLKLGLMHDLLAGRVRVKVAESVGGTV